MKRNCLLFLALIVAVPTQAERYRVFEDGFGNIQAQSVEDTESGDLVEVEQAPPVEIDLKERQASDRQKALADAKKAQSETDNKPTVESESSLVSSKAPQDEGNLIPEPVFTSELQEQEESNIDPFEAAYLESVRESQRESIEALLNSPEKSFDATDISQGDYVDGDALERSGGVRDESDSPYYIYIDADGRQRVEFYDPAVSKQARKAHSRQITKETSEAAIYLRESLDGSGKINFVEQAEPEALQILLAGATPASEIDRIKSSCCAGLPDVRVRNIGENRANYYELTKDDITFKFTNGNSKFLRLALPETDSSSKYPLLLRTFIKAYEIDGIKNGAFMPQVITLDKTLDPVRLVTDIVFSFHPETWTKFGYFEAIIEIDPELEERYVLINTTSQMLRNTTTVETDEAFIKVHHMKTGSFEVTALVSQSLYSSR